MHTYTGAAAFKAMMPLSVADFILQEQFMNGILTSITEKEPAEDTYTPTVSEQQSAQQHMSSLFNQ